jgi:hypothetical protein
MSILDHVIAEAGFYSLSKFIHRSAVVDDDHRDPILDFVSNDLMASHCGLSCCNFGIVRNATASRALSGLVGCAAPQKIPDDRCLVADLTQDLPRVSACGRGWMRQSA